MSNCCARVWSGFHSHGCSRPGSIERDGKFYCKQHDPQAVKEREQKTRKRQQLEFDKKWDKSLLGNRAADSYEKHCRVPLEAVEGDFLTKVLGLLFEAVPFVPADYDEECGFRDRVDEIKGMLREEKEEEAEDDSCDCRTCRFRVLDSEERWFCESFDKTLEKLEIFCTRFEKKEEE